jgi:integrase
VTELSNQAASVLDPFQAMLALGEKMARRRFQAPKIEQRKNGTFFIRPWVDIVKPDGTKGREKRVIDLDGATTKRDAQRIAKEKMDKVNQPDVILLSQMTVGILLDTYFEKHVDTQLGVAARKKYASLVKNHIRPFFGDMKLSEIRPLVLQDYFDAKKEAKLSWNTRTDIRNVMSGMFERAIFWGYWKLRNPIDGVKIGKKELVYKRREWSVEDTQRLIASLPEDVRILTCTALLTTLRISELLGLREKHFDAKKKTLNIQERYYRGDIAGTKTSNSERIIPVSDWLAQQLEKLCMGDPERHIFRIATKPDWGTKQSFCRDDRSIHRYFLRPAAEELGLYTKGFGFHDLRREAITRYEDQVGLAQASKVAGHSKPVMTLHYTKLETERLRKGVQNMENRLLGAPVPGVH